MRIILTILLIALLLLVIWGPCVFYYAKYLRENYPVNNLYWIMIIQFFSVVVVGVSIDVFDLMNPVSTAALLLVVIAASGVLFLMRKKHSGSS